MIQPISCQLRVANYIPETVGPTLLLFKFMAPGAVTPTQCLFSKWRQYKHQMQMEAERERQQHQYNNNMDALAIQQHTRGGTTAETTEATTPLGYNYALLDEQELANINYPQVLPELRDLRQQIREEQQAKQEIQKELEVNHTALQRLQIGVDTRDRAQRDEIRRLQRLEQRQTIKTTKAISDGGNEIEHAKDPMWESSVVLHDHWQQDLKRIGRLPTNANITPVYAMAVNTDINKAIDLCVDDYIENGGNIADRIVVNSQIVADLGVRVRLRLADKGIIINDKACIAITIATTKFNTNGKANGDGYRTPINVVKQLLFTPSTESSPEREVGGVNDLQWQRPNDNEEDEQEDGEDPPDDPNGSESQTNRQYNRAGGDGDRVK